MSLYSSYLAERWQGTCLVLDFGSASKMRITRLGFLVATLPYYLIGLFEEFSHLHSITSGLPLSLLRF